MPKHYRIASLLLASLCLGALAARFVTSDSQAASVKHSHPTTLLDRFKVFVFDSESSTFYAKWSSQNPNDLQRWKLYRDALIGGGSPFAPAMSTHYGAALVDGGLLYQYGSTPTTPPTVTTTTTPATSTATTSTTTTTAPISTTTPTTTSGVPAPSLGSALPAPLPPSAGATVQGSDSQSLGTLFASLSAGETLCLHGGTYGSGLTSQASLAVSGSATAPITIRSCPGETAIIAQLVKATGSYLRLTGLVFERNNYPTDTRYGQGGSNPGGNVGVWLAGSHITFEHNEVRNATMSGIFGGGPYDQVLANWIHNNGTTADDHGMYWTSGPALIANNIVTSNSDFGIQLGYTGAAGNVIANNTTARNGVGHSWAGSGTVDFSGTSGNLFVNNIAYGNGGYGYKNYDSGQNALSHDDAFANPAGATNGSYSSVTALLTSDPLFVSSSDYRLQAASPARGAGDTAYTPSFDYYGVARTTPDLGAAS